MTYTVSAGIGGGIALLLHANLGLLGRAVRGVVPSPL